MQNQLALAILASVVLLGAALFAVLRTDRRRVDRQQRLKAITAIGPSATTAGPTVSLRRPLRQRAASGLFALPAGLWARLDGGLAATGNWIGVPHLVVAGVVAAVITSLFARRLMGLSPGLSTIVAVVAAVAAPILLLRFAQSRYRNRFLDAFPDALDLIRRAVRAGLPAADAMEVAAREIRPPVGIELQRTLDETRIGVEIGEALQHTADRIRVPDFRFYVVALALQRRTGGALAETLQNLSNVIRRRKEVRLKARALSAEAKASAAVLAVLPFFVGGILFILNPVLMSALLHDPRGRFMLGLAFVSLVTGISVMGLIIKRTMRY